MFSFGIIFFGNDTHLALGELNLDWGMPFLNTIRLFPVCFLPNRISTSVSSINTLRSLPQTSPDTPSGPFRLISTDHTTNQDTIEEFDHVIVASGHFSTPNVPYYPGFDTFQGRVLHAHDFREAREFAGKDILIVGTSYSAEDIASQCWKYGCNKVYLSWRTAPMGFHWPESFETLPLLTHVEGKTVFFRNGERREVDAIILCTGYKHHFPFLSAPLKLSTANRLWPDSLLRGIFWPRCADLMYVGMQDQWFTSTCSTYLHMFSTRRCSFA